MSIKVMQWVWDNSQSENGARLVLLAIADNAADDGSHAYPSVRELMRKSRLSERGVQDATKALVKIGELEIEANGAPRGRSNMYRVVMTPQNLHPAESAPLPPQNLHPNPAESAPGTVLEPPGEPSPPPGDAQSADRAAPEINAGSIVADWIDYCGGRGIKLTPQAIARYGKKIKELLASGFTPNLIKTALARMLERGLHSRPGLLDELVIEVQTGNRPATPKAGGFKSSAEKNADHQQRERDIARIADELAEQRNTDPRDYLAAKRIRAEAEQIYASGMTTCTATGYSPPNGGIVDAEWTEDVTRREVTGG